MGLNSMLTAEPKKKCVDTNNRRAEKILISSSGIVIHHVVFEEAMTLLA